jgi:hypothetical protein
MLILQLLLLLVNVAVGATDLFPVPLNSTLKHTNGVCSPDTWLASSNIHVPSVDVCEVYMKPFALKRQIAIILHSMQRRWFVHSTRTMGAAKSTTTTQNIPLL